MNMHICALFYVLSHVPTSLYIYHHTATNGVVIATEKKLPSVLIDEAYVQKVELINPSTGMYIA